MADFVDTIGLDLPEPRDTEDNIPTDAQSITTCVVGIRSNLPYDSSKFTNNDTTFYTEFTYDQLATFLELVQQSSQSDIPTENSANTENTTNTETRKKTSNMNLMFVADCFKNPSVKMIFRFLCSSDCADGAVFVNTVITQTVYEFVKFVCTRDCVCEVSDHSMGSFFNNWNDLVMGLEKPIEILKFSHSGPFKMVGHKTDFVNSVHPTLVQIGELSSSEEIEITFNNMGGTKVYKILSPIVKIISKGNQIKPTVRNGEQYRYFGIRQENLNDEIYGEVPVHSEFPFQNGKIVVSATHWCNLDSVETPVDLPTLARYCTTSMGREATVELEYSLSTAQTQDECKRIISETVRQISSGSSRPVKKSKPNSTSDQNQDI